MIKITFKKQLRKFNVGHEIIIDQPKTLLVSRNGYGKSTLLHLLFCIIDKDDYDKEYFGDRFEYRDVNALKENVSIEHDYNLVYYYDSHLGNAKRLSGGAMMERDDVTFKLALNAATLSNGQDNINQYLSFTDNFIERRINDGFKGKALLLLDEPESGFDLIGQFKLIKSFNRICEEGKFDIICATHCMPVIASNEFPIYDLQKRIWLIGSEYIRGLNES